MVENLEKHNQLARRAAWQLERARERKSVRELKAAIRAFEEVMEVMEVMSLRHPDRPACLGNLGAAYQLLYEWTRDPTAIDHPVRINALIVDGLPEHQLNRAMYRRNLKLLVVQVFVESETGPRPSALLGRLVPLVREVAADGEDRSVFRDALGTCLGESFELTGDRDALTELIALDRERSASVPRDDPDLGGLPAIRTDPTA